MNSVITKNKMRKALSHLNEMLCPEEAKCSVCNNEIRELIKFVDKFVSGEAQEEIANKVVKLLTSQPTEKE